MLLPILVAAPLLADTAASAVSSTDPISFPALVAEDQKALDAKDGGPPKWTGSVNVGASYSDGNTDSRTVNAAVDAERRSEHDRWTFKGYWNYGESRDSNGELGITDRRAGASIKYDYFLTKKLYVFGIAAIETDFLADISKRYYAGPGVGYQWQETDAFKWGSEVGVTYFNTDYTHSEDKEYVAARIANNITWVINENTTFENSAEIQPSLEDSSDFYGKSDTKLKVSLTKAMFAQLQWVYQFTNQPADGKERNDNLVVLGIGWKF
jgi:putative salt-induced outer membrane protein YdiY